MTQIYYKFDAKIVLHYQPNRHMSV